MSVRFYRYRHRRTLGSTPPPDLAYGEIAYSDENQTLYVGRPDNEPPVQIRVGNVWDVRAVGDGVRISSIGVRLYD